MWEPFGSSNRSSSGWVPRGCQSGMQAQPSPPPTFPPTTAGGDNKLYATFVPAEDPSNAPPGTAPRGVSILARDMQTVTFFDSKGEFAGVRRLGSGNALEVEGLRITPSAIVAATGLELKSDPGVPLVYAGFGGEGREACLEGEGWRMACALVLGALGTPRCRKRCPPCLHCHPPHHSAHPPTLLSSHLPKSCAGLCITTVVSYLSHSQVWAAQAGSGVMVGGTTNRAKVFFEQELSEVLGSVPELPSAPALVDSPSGGKEQQR